MAQPASTLGTTQPALDAAALSPSRGTAAARPARWAVRAAGAAAAIIGATYLAAWLTGLAPRWSAAGAITMKANMSLALLLAGAALLLLEPENATAVRRAVGTAAGAIVLLVGLLTLVEHLFGVDLRIDQLLAVEPPGAAATVSPNRIGPPGSSSLVLVGAGLLALAWRRRLAFFLGLATSLVVLVPAVGFVYGIDPLYGRTGTGIAWPTVIALLCLGAGLMLADAAAGPLALLWRPDAGGVLLRHFLPAAVAIPLVVGYLRVHGERHRLFDSATGNGLLSLVLVVVLSSLLWRSAHQLSANAARREKAEASLRESEQRYATMFDGSPFAIALTKMPEGVTVSVNDAFLRLFEYPRDAVVGKTSVDLGISDPGSQASVGAELHRRGSVRDLEVVRRSRSGKRRVLSLNLDRVSLGGESFVLTTIQDVTERRQAQDRLAEAARRKDEFLSMLSHELRNPLAPIRNAIYILEHTNAAGEQAARARSVIQRQTEHLARLVDDLLDVTRIARGKIALRRERVDLRAIARRTAEDLRDLVEDRGVELRVELPETDVWADADETRIAQIVGNLLQNAAKFTPSGSVTLSLRARDGEAELSVRDTGIGIEPALLRDLFQPFVQGGRTLARSEGGLGLGLALVKGIAELHGGSVRAESEGAGKGTNVVVRLPLAEGATSASPAPPEATAARTARRVLVVDDNADAAETLAAIVKVFGHTAEVAHDGPSAVASARARAPDVVLCDVGLPGMTGYEVARTLRAELRDVRLVAVTGYGRTEDVTAALEAGFDAQLTKPLDPRELERLLAS